MDSRAIKETSKLLQITLPDVITRPRNWYFYEYNRERRISSNIKENIVL